MISTPTNMKQAFTKIIDLIFLAKQNGVDLVLNGERLQLKVAENKDIDKTLLEEIKSNKQSIIDFLNNENWKSKRVEENHNKINKFDRESISRTPLSFSQERLWFVDQLEGSVQYNLPTVVRLKGKLNRHALMTAMQTIVNRHEVLRTVFLEEGGHPYQFIKNTDGWAVAFSDGAKYKHVEALQKYIQQLINEPFDLSRDYMVRASLIGLNDQEHVLVVTMHHIASDAWSLPIIIGELMELYAAYSEDRPARLAPLQIQYADYAVWQRNFLQGEVLDKKIDYWKNKLEEVVPLQLPTDYARPAVRSSRGASLELTIEKKLSDQIQMLCQQQGTTLYMTLLAAFNVLLHKYSGQQDICVGTSIANRSQQEVERLIGFFVNTLALRSEVKSELSFTEFLQQVRSSTMEAYEHQDVSFEKVVETVVKERDVSRSPLFQVMLVLKNTPASSQLRLGELELSAEEYESKIAKFDITVFITETANGLKGSVSYSTDLYHEATIKRMIHHYKELLSCIVKDPQQNIGQLQMLTKEEEHQLLVEFNDTKVDYPKDKTITDLFEEQVARTPGATAVIFEEKHLTYQQLNERANQLAHYLRSKGVKEETLVPIFMERGLDMMVGIMGILKSGATYVPIDSDFPADRISYMLKDTGSPLLLCNAETRTKLVIETDVDIIETDGDLVEIQLQPTHNTKTDLAPSNAAYVIYTSGSTGKPKGVVIEHRNLVDYVFGLSQKVQIDQCKSYALVSTIATDLGNTVIYPSLVFGGTLHIFSKESVSNIDYLHEYFKEHSIECLKIVPSHWKALSTGEHLLLPSKLMVFGGEALQSELIENISLSGAACRVVNHYGPTETTIGKLLHEVQPAGRYNKTIPIGRPFSNTQVYILSKTLQLCPVGVPGELHIAGEGVARGYLNNEELTRTKFINDPFNDKANSLMYRTGDMVKYLADGNIEFIGRVDDQVKIRGYRIELGEIETAINQCELVSQAVVLAREDKQGNKRLVGYIVPEEAYKKGEIIAYLKEKLPEYMVPALLVELESLPLTANGKIDRKALPDPDTDELLKGQYVAPANETEEKLAAIWQDVLEVEQVGVHDDFFELGGHSLLAVRLISAIRKEFVVEMPISDVFDHPTIASLAGRLETPSDVTVLPTIEVAKSRPEHIPLSFSQERLWFIDQLEGSVQYHVPAVLRLKGRLNREALNHSLETIVDRHEVLRTVILQEEGKAYQFIKPKGEWQLSVVDGSIYKEDTDGLQQYLQHLIKHPFDLSKDYMIRGHLITFNDLDNILVVTLHHIASDGWSKSVLVKEVVELYDSYNDNRPVNLTPLNIQYADYAIWQRNYLEGEVLDKKLDYWKQKLDEVPSLQLPTDYPRPAVQSTRGAGLNFNIDKLLSGQLQELSQKHGATLFMTLLAAFKVLLHRYSGQNDICVGTPIAGRLQQDLEGLIGFFVNTLALRSEVNSEFSFVKLLQQMKATMLEAYENQEVPFEKVVDSVVKERDLSRNPLFQVMIVLRNTPEIPDLNLGEARLSPEGHERKTALFDLTFFITETPNGMQVSVEYCTDLYNEATIARMIAHFQELLRVIVKSPEQKIGSLPMLTKADKQQLLVDFNDTVVQYSKGKSIIDLIQDQAASTPDAVAVVYEKLELTYQELNERSNQFAHYLQTKGVKAESLVPLCIERSHEMIVGILGILKAGGAYVPIDPEYPEERIIYMLEDTKASFVVCSKHSKSKIPAADKLGIIELDTEWSIINQHSSDNLQTDIKSHHLAYVIYTSGSTGKPKGVMIEHGSVYSFICWCQQEFSASRFEIAYAGTSMCFDLSIFEMFYPLSVGKCLRVIENGLHIGKYLPVDNYVMTNSVPAVVQNLLKEGTDLGNISVMNMAGEPIPLQVQQSLDAENIEIRNLYGPTEDTTYSTMFRLKNGMPILIGKPISNTQIHILNREMELVPVGVSGEICIGGAGLARGYLNRKGLTAEKFITNPFNNEAGARLYRTGDLGRWLADGTIEYLGRLDYQVKIRGYRIELGEIETVLGQSSLVSEAVVLAREEKEGTKRLVGYIVPNWHSVKAREKELYTRQVANWKELYETEYEKTEEDENIDPEFNIIGWNDSFTGVPIAAQQMKDWLSDIVEVILSENPGHVLEIGCGTGLIYYQLAGKVKKYIGTDFSRSSINQIHQRISKGLRDYGSTELQVSAAHEISLSEKEQVDTIIVNSVVQYFPGEDYLTDVIKNSISVLKGKGRIIIGDVRDNRLLRLFKSRLLIEKLQGTVSIKEFKWAVDQEVLKEEELCFSPGYFYKLKELYPEITHVEIQWKHSSFINELTLYRYNVVIYVGVQKDIIEPNWQSWNEGVDQQILNQLQQKSPVIAFKDVPNPRLWQERLLDQSLENHSAGTVGDLAGVMRKEDKGGNSIKQLLGVVEAKGYHYRLFVNDDPLKVNVVMELHPTASFFKEVYSDRGTNNNGMYTNIPLLTNISSLLQSEIRSELQQRLPEYMVPSALIMLGHLPLTSNGKVDRRFLSEREDKSLTNKLNYEAPRTEVEQTLATIWQELLGLEKVGVYDNFFEIGGHSLSAIRVISAIRKQMKVELAIKDLFHFTTINDLSKYVEIQTIYSGEKASAEYELLNI